MSTATSTPTTSRTSLIRAAWPPLSSGVAPSS